MLIHFNLFIDGRTSNLPVKCDYMNLKSNVLQKFNNNCDIQLCIYLY